MKFFLISAFLAVAASAAIVKRDAPASGDVVSTAIETMKQNIEKMASHLSPEEVKKIMDSAVHNTNSTISTLHASITEKLKEVSPEVKASLTSLQESLTKAADDLKEKVQGSDAVKNYSEIAKNLEAQAQAINGKISPALQSSVDEATKAAQEIMKKLFDSVHEASPDKHTHNH